jgi:pimeloyl-ACP methyl ester carboxylesterase
MVAGQGASGEPSCMKMVRTAVAEIGYLESGQREGVPVLFLHGFPDDARTWDGVVAELAGAGLRLVRPFQRGFGPSRVTAIAAHSGQVAALAQDESSRSGAVLVDGSGRSGPSGLSGEMADGLSA